MINTPQDLNESPFSFELEGGNGAVTVSLELAAFNGENSPTGRFIINHEHTSGNYQYFLEPDAEMSWDASGNCPDFLDKDISQEIGNHIEEHFEEGKE